MSKFICLCGMTFKKQKDCDFHTKMYEDLALSEGFPRHKVFKQHWQARLATWFLNYRWEYFFRFTGIFMLYFIAIHHFKISLSLLESVGVGVGLGLAIKRD